MDKYHVSLPWVEKYRPEKLIHIVSQDEIINTITKLLDNNKLPHMLFHGGSGTGKTSSIIAIAKKMYGTNYKNMILELNGSDDRGIDVVRDKIKQFSGSAQIFGNGVKLVILDEADSMTYDAQSALRRIIEKYTNNTRFCLICNYANKIIPALQSRCMQFRFSPLKDDIVIKKIKKIAQKENVDITKSAIDTIVKLSKGDLRKAINLLQACNMSYTTIDHNAVYSCSGLPQPNEVANIIDILMKYNMKDAYNSIVKIKEDKGLSLIDLVREINEMLLNIKLSNKQRIYCINALSNIEKNLSIGTTDSIQLLAIIGAFINMRNIS